MKKTLIALSLLSLLVSACDSAAPVLYELELAGYSFRVELANTPALLKRGLSGRDYLDPDKGMLFVQPVPEYMTMWMKGCKIPLDVLFFDQQRKLINFHTMAVPDPAVPNGVLPRYWSDKPAKYALELPAGTARRLAIQNTELISFSPRLLKALSQQTE